jgi:hypothetical protein
MIGRKTTPPGYEEPVGALRFQYHEIILLGSQQGNGYGRKKHLLAYGIPRYLFQLLPRLQRYNESQGGPGWAIVGPTWTTRTCVQDDSWRLFEIGHTSELGWWVDGLNKLLERTR